MKIELDTLSDSGIADLLEKHLQDMHQYSPAESIHALDVEQLKQPGLTFWSARINNKVVGCGALYELSESEGEVKSMKVDSAHLRKGVAARLLEQIISEAHKRNYKKVYLETGSHEAFLAAVALYERFGFVECEPFAHYQEDPYSRFYLKQLS
ncbi:GNAT family N-acetyltransferase [Reinekea thalattae]|uniref:GNAT family N-acetyltransferase n=1 Tax=Reinekea thalattae TaxID=2593301 RepID=A0A5C8Z3B9_9GAMM|nr:GNAT family N-acetyltransferase [Reinekea thalattae]TXR52047.1 GNAT family N-acetyltransferase [Reinekea thalattae]